MRKIFFLLFATIFMLECKEKTINRSNLEIFESAGMKGKPVHMYFLNSQEGYLFNYTTESQDQTAEQLNDPSFIPNTTDISTIYKTIDGGKNWAKVYTLKDYAFYDTAFCDGSSIYIKIINNKESLKNKILKFDFRTFQSTILAYNFERMGEFWAFNQKVYINSKNNGSNNIYSIDKDFRKLDSVRVNRVFKDRVTLLNQKPYVLTWDNEIYDIQNDEGVKIPSTDELACITKNGVESLIVVGKSSSSVTLYRYNVMTRHAQFLKEFDGYSIIQGLQSNEKVIYGFIGNIKGPFTEYDLFYSLDHGKTWQIQELKEKSYIRPVCLVGNILYIYSGGDKFQKIVFT